MSYDALGHLASVASGLTTASYTYNFLNQRAKKAIGATTTVYIYDPSGKLIAEANGLGAITTEYIYLGSLPLAMVRGANIYFMHTDHLSTPLRVTDAVRRLVWEASYNSFGAANINDDVDNDGIHFVQNLRFPGQYVDAESGLHYNWHRYYAPELGRYAQPDPLVQPHQSSYSYVGNYPLRGIDPTGLLTALYYGDLDVGYGVAAEAASGVAVQRALSHDASVSSLVNSSSYFQYYSLGVGIGLDFLNPLLPVSPFVFFSTNVGYLNDGHVIDNLSAVWRFNIGSMTISLLIDDAGFAGSSVGWPKTGSGLAYPLVYPQAGMGFSFTNIIWMDVKGIPETSLGQIYERLASPPAVPDLF
jgi:RHS repeat-associated protein